MSDEGAYNTTVCMILVINSAVTTVNIVNAIDIDTDTVEEKYSA